MKLKRLNQKAKRIVSNKRFFSGDLERIPENRIQQHIGPIEGNYGVEKLNNYLSDLMDQYDQHDVEMDKLLGPKIHQLLSLSRRKAADPGIWHYLTVVMRPDFVRYRWEFNNYSYMRKRFLGNVRSWDTNTFARLWWAAELTKRKDISDPYRDTKFLLERQTFARALFDREYGWYKPMNLAFISVLREEKKTVFEEVAKRLNKTLSTVKLETLNNSQIERLIKGITQEVTG